MRACSLFATFAALGLSLGCGGGAGEEGGNSDSSEASLSAAESLKAATAGEALPALIVWTGVDPLDAVAEGLEALFAVHSSRYPKRSAALRYLPTGATVDDCRDEFVKPRAVASHRL